MRKSPTIITDTGSSALHSAGMRAIAAASRAARIIGILRKSYTPHVGRTASCAELRAHQATHARDAVSSTSAKTQPGQIADMTISMPTNEAAQISVRKNGIANT